VIYVVKKQASRLLDSPVFLCALQNTGGEKHGPTEPSKKSKNKAVFWALTLFGLWGIL
jgi:hypothetical protein